ncbi:hypothetical protein SCAR479_03364 [Seiridium cardinale]|uniref:Uncharacterized protein n=1 Tax=Seiridium cardinale TaxID=138064 RepID=A0ABR2Y1A5_9PEZI
MVQRKHAPDAPRALWATPVPNMQPKSMPSKLLFWKKREKAEQPSARECNPAIKASSFPTVKVQQNPEWRSNPNKFLKPYCQPVVINAIRSISKDATCNFHFVNILKTDASLAPIINVLNLPPTTADRYVPLLHLFFTKREVARISADVENIKERIVRLHHRPQDDYSWWDMLREDLDDVCARAIKDYFAREEQMWFVPRLAHRYRRVTCSDQYRHREIREWRWNDGQWWLKTAFPKSMKTRETAQATDV